MVDNFYFWYFVEGVIVCHEVTGALDEVTDLDADIPQEGTAFPTSHDHDGSWVHFGQIEFMENPDCMEWVPTSLCDNPSLSSPKESGPALNELVVICEVIFFFKLYLDRVHWCVTCCS